MTQSNRQIDRRALFTSGAAAALLAATGVSAAPQRGGRLRAALSGADRADDWAGAPANLFMMAAVSTVYEGLTEIAADGTLRGVIAQTWTRESDGWRFKLRDGISFHDGAPLRAAHVADVLNGQGLMAEHWRNEILVSAADDDPNLPYRLAGPSFVIRAPHDLYAGTGFYAVHKFDAGRHFIATRAASHWRDGQAGWFDSVEFVHMADKAVRSQALAEGLVDVADVDAVPNPAHYAALPDAAHTMQVVHNRIARAAHVGAAWPLDNFRMAERWWLGAT